MKRLAISLMIAGLVLAAAARSAAVRAQVAAPAAPAVKKAAPAQDAGNAAAVAKQFLAKKQATGKDAAKQAAEVKKADVAGKAAAVKKAIEVRKRHAVMVNANANLNPMIQQFVQQGRPMMRSEVLLAHSLFHPSKEKLRVLHKEAETALESVAKEMADYQQGGRRVMIPGQAAKNPEWAKRLQETIAIEFKKTLNAEQFARYQSEVEKRFTEHKVFGLRFLVDAIDRELLLTPKQRDQLMTVLEPKWEEGWSMYLEYFMYGNQFFPQEVDRLVSPVLDETQRKVWQGTQKVGMFWGFGGIWAFQNGQDPLQELLAEGKENPVAKNVVEAASPPPR